MNILLLDMGSSDLGDSLRDILEGAVCGYGRIISRHVSVEDLSSDDDRVAQTIEVFHPHVAIIILTLHTRESSLRAIQRLATEHASLPVIAAIADDNPDDLIEILKMGIIDFITPPFRRIDIIPRVWRILRHAAEEKNLTHSLKEKVGLRQLVGQSPAFIREIHKVPTIARCDASVLISGETGTGKEMCARAIHYLSPRADKPFVPVNCGAIPADLVENELFGHMKGAYTGADSRQPGLIAEAEGGTLFLDEIDCLPLSSQVKLVRFLQEKEYRTLGSSKIHRADVRVVSATNIDIGEATRRGKFRKDLYYRLNIMPITLPPLRERKEDIPGLSEHFLNRYSAGIRGGAKEFTYGAISKLLAHDWPGNVRELEHIVERAVVFSKQTAIMSSDIFLEERMPAQADESFRQAKARVVGEFERKYIQNLLISHEGNVSRAASAAEKNRRAFWELMRKHKISPDSYRLDSQKKE